MAGDAIGEHDLTEQEKGNREKIPVLFKDLYDEHSAALNEEF